MKLDKSYKVRVTPEQSREIQELVFGLGGKWNGGTDWVINETIPFLYVTSGLVMTCDSKAQEYFGYASSENTEIQADDLIALLTDLPKSAENPLQKMELTPEFEALPDELKSSQTPITSFSFIDVLKKSAQSILTQDNAATANPAYCVKDKKRVYGFNGTTTNDYVWYCRDDDSEYDNTDDMYKALDTIADEINEDEIVLNGNTYERAYYELEESTVTTCFTREQAQRYIDENRHNLKNPFIYVESFNRNLEMIAVRELLIFLAENPTMFDGVTVAEGALDE